MIGVRGWTLILGAGLWAMAPLGCGDDDDGGTGGTTATGTTQTGTTQTGTTQTGTTQTGTGGSGGSGGGTGGTGGDTGGTGGTGGGTPGCDTTPMSPAAEDAGMFQGAFVYVGQSTLGDPVDVLYFELYDGTPGVETLTINNDDYATCMNCVLFYRGCDGMLSNCQQAFLAQSGQIEITSSGSPGDDFTGILRDADFVEVTIANGQSTPVANGEQFCWAPYGFDSAIQ